jgi:hypothetical protein
MRPYTASSLAFTVATFSASCVLLTLIPIFFVLCRTLAPAYVAITE